MKRIPMSFEQLADLLEEMALLVRLGDAREGSIEYLMPPPELIPPEWEELPEQARAWYEPVALPLGADALIVYRLIDGVTTEDCVVKAEVRIGNRDGEELLFRIGGDP